MLKKINILVIISLFLIMHKSDFFKNISTILEFRYNERISKIYGYCEREGIGYVNYIKKNFKINRKIDLINTLPINNNNDGKWATHNTDFSESDKSGYLIVINHKKLSNRINLDRNVPFSYNFKINLDQFKILHNFNDCYFLKKND